MPWQRSVLGVIVLACAASACSEGRPWRAKVPVTTRGSASNGSPSSAASGDRAGFAPARPEACSAPPAELDKIGTSHDGKTRVWEEREGDAPEEGVPAPAHLCFERAGARRVLLRNRSPRADAGAPDQLAGYSDFVFSRDDRLLFFTTDAWSAARAAHAVELIAGNEWFVVDGAILEELDRGPFKGHLCAAHFRLDDAHPMGSKDYRGRIPTFTVVDLRGRTVRKLPEDEAARTRVLEGP